MDICVMIEGQEDVGWPQWQALAQTCERYGLAGLYRSDHLLPLDGHHERVVLDAWGTICALAATTSTLRMGTLVSPVTFRHPSVLAKLAVTADAISGGRVDLGLGAGWFEAEHRAYGIDFGDAQDRRATLEEQFVVIRGLLARPQYDHRRPVQTCHLR